MSLCITRTQAGLELRDYSTRQRPLRIDFSSGKLRRRLNVGGKELLAKATGAREGLRVFDSTAGLGVDSFILASRGCDVVMVERSHTLWRMLEDALHRARNPETDSELCAVAQRMTLMRGEAKHVLTQLGRQGYVPDVVVIDPMFPERRKQAEVKGEMQRLQRLLGKDEDTAALVERAIGAGSKRVVVKRPLHGAPATERAPSHQVKGKASRFDVYIVT